MTAKMATIVKVVIVILTVLVLVVFAAVSLTPTLLPQPTNGLSLRNLLTAEGCEAACWQGIQPGASLDEFADLSANLSGIATSRSALSGGPGRVHIYELEAFNPLTTSPDNPTVFVEFDTAVTFVWQISLSNLEVCPSTVVSTYGIPPVVREMPDTSVWPMPGHVGLGYPAEGLLFWYKQEIARIVSAAVMPDDRVNSVLNAGIPLQWETIAAGSLHCQDNFHP